MRKKGKHNIDNGVAWDCPTKSCDSWKKSRIIWKALMNDWTCGMGWNCC